ncbi:MAG: thiamine pyrophosphate-binding protein [Eubacteriales bacterium]
MIVSDYIFKFLKEKGVDTAFMVSGGQAMYLNDALARCPEIKTICAHHEQTCGMAADAYSRITGKLGVALVTAGPGSINVVNGLVGGWTDSAPMMIISGQSALACVQYQEKSGIRQFGVQGIFIRPFVEKATKYFITVDDPSKIRFYMEKAYYLAMSGRPGPVWVDVPLDIQRMEVPVKLLNGYSPEIQYDNRRDKIKTFNEVWNMMKESKRPLIIAGQGIRLSNSQNELLTFIKRFRIPIITTRLGIDIVESDNELYVGRPGNYGERAANFAIQNADLIIAIGSRLSTSSIGHDARQFGRNAKKIVVDIDIKELDKPGVCIDLKVNEDAKKFITGLSKIADETQWITDEKWVNICSNWKAKYPVVLPEYENEKPINSYSFTERLSQKTDNEHIILVDTGSCFHVACQTWKIKKGQRFLTTGGLSSMGYWVAGIGACAANQYKKTIVITGDGSLQMNIQEFATIKHNNLPIKVFIFNNNGYLLIRQTQHNYMEDRFFGEGPNSGVWCPDSLEIAKAYGIKGVRISNIEELDEKIDEVLNYDGPVICDVMNPEWQLIIPRVSSDKLPEGTLVSRKYEDMFPYLSREEFYDTMVIKPER